MSRLEFACKLAYPGNFTLDAAFTTDADLTVLSGPSGSGKTSILSLIAGLRRPQHGIIRLGDIPLFDSDKHLNVPPELRRVGYVFQEQLLFPHMKVGRNLQYGWKRRPLDAQAVDFERVVEVLELSDLLTRLPHTLSGGQKQRVALGRALLCGPRLLLLDEPLAGVDDELKGRVLDYVERVLAEWRIPTLYVTHNAAEVDRLAQRLVNIRDGRIVGNEVRA